MTREAPALIAILQADDMRGQILRFGIAGGVSTLIYSAVYLPLTLWVFPRAQAVYAVPPAFLVAVACGYVLHSRWSFKGLNEARRGWQQQAQFVAVQGSGMALNAAVTWIGTAKFGLPGWAVLIPAVALATLFTFILNRWLVFA